MSEDLVCNNLVSQNYFKIENYFINNIKSIAASKKIGMVPSAESFPRLMQKNGQFGALDLVLRPHPQNKILEVTSPNLMTIAK